jgi:catechol 2,3-dioxygenase-like lactoylglutathione lyase family enzyme
MITTTATASKLASVILPVADQDRQLEFYTEALGLEKRADVPFGPGRWIEVAPTGAETPIALCPPGPDGAAGGKETGISLQTDDIDSYHAQLKARDVDVDAEVSRMGDPVPPLFWLRDPEGNRLMVVESV